MDTRADAMRRWLTPDAERSAALPSDKLAVAYEAALAAIQLRDWDRVDASLERLRALLQGNPRSDRRAERAVLMLGAEAFVARGDGARAARLLRTLEGDTSRPVMMLVGQALLRMPAPDAAALKRSADELQTWVSVHPNDAPAWSLLGQSWALLGQPLRAVRAEAETRLVLGDLPGAIDRLRAGQRMARGGNSVDFIEASVIDARLRAIEAELRQLTAEERAGK
jgi:predicted Zn-dependent protease